MAKSILFGLSLLALLAASPGGATERPSLTQSDRTILHGGDPALLSSAARDSLYLIGPWGSGATVNGQFQSASGIPAWNGWTSVDLTARTEVIWHADTYNAVSGTYSAWCGEIAFAACGENDVAGGYGHGYNELLVWRHQVADPAAATTVTIGATVNHNTEPGYDYSNLGFFKAGAPIAYLWTADGEGEQVPIAASVTYAAGEYVGEAGDEVAIAWHVTSDAIWDDADCNYASDGALQVDDVIVAVDNGGAVTDRSWDFEDGTLGDWAVELPPGVGDYAHLRVLMADEDPCADNRSPLVCFTADDEMEAQRGLPWQWCLDWCYGPGGYIVHTEGGAAGPEAHLHNAVQSPVIAWPGDDFDGLRFHFDLYVHEDLTADAPGIFASWGVRSTASTNPDDIGGEPFLSRNFLRYGSPRWMRDGDDNLGDLLAPDPRWVQVRLAVQELGYYWGWDGNDGYPAPYFDNAQLVAFSNPVPLITAYEYKLAQDAFPADGRLHAGAEMGDNDVRFDMAQNISPRSDLRNDPGDSIVARIVSVRQGASLVETEMGGGVAGPTLHFALKRNSAFGSELRIGSGPFTVPLGTATLEGEITDDGAITGTMTGWVRGAPAQNYGSPLADTWMFDLPDEDFLYPGDVLHYYLEAWDDRNGDLRSATLPADLSGFGEFGYDTGNCLPSAYEHLFVVRALPVLYDDAGDQNPILFWNDGQESGLNEWHCALLNLSFWNYDLFTTNDPTLGEGNGLGGRAELEQIAGYDVILYSSGANDRYTITNENFDLDAGDDVGLLRQWLELGDRSLLATGDNLASDMSGASDETHQFVEDWLGVTVLYNDQRFFTGGSTSPVVNVLPANPVFFTIDQWRVNGGCPTRNTFDAVEAVAGEKLADFGDFVTGISAATLLQAPNGSQVISLPYDLASIWSDYDPPLKLNQPSIIPPRAYVLREAIASFGMLPPLWWPGSSDTPEAGFTAGAHPNPFNPATRIEWRLPDAGPLSVQIFDLRGHLVRTLVDGMREAGLGHVMWDGTDDGGRGVASGAYFYEVRGAGETKTAKIMMLK